MDLFLFILILFLYYYLFIWREEEESPWSALEGVNEVFIRPSENYREITCNPAGAEFVHTNSVVNMEYVTQYEKGEAYKLPSIVFHFSHNPMLTTWIFECEEDRDWYLDWIDSNYAEEGPF